MLILNKNYAENRIVNKWAYLNAIYDTSLYAIKI